jgi:hypothetical protein
MPGHGESIGFNEEQLLADNVVDKLKEVLYNLDLFYLYVYIVMSSAYLLVLGQTKVV